MNVKSMSDKTPVTSPKIIVMAVMMTSTMMIMMAVMMQLVMISV